MRATRDLLRRRIHLRRQRSERLAQVPNTHRQDNLPEMGQKLADTATRDGVAARVADPAVQQRIAVDVALLTYDDELLSGVEVSSVKRATQ
jgi:transposase